jgi:hypothetical protein
MTAQPTFPTDDEISIAVAWLNVNEGDGGEAEACKAVGAWLEHERFERMLRREARAGGVPVAQLRQRLAGLRRRVEQQDSEQ